MNYPIWSLYYAGGGFLIALIAVVHVYVAHFAVGGGAFLVITEMKAYRENSPKILDYVRAHSKFFLLLTVVFGSVTGVGIWITISLFQPQATSFLIHQFVFAWASEWVCFLGEIIAIFIYYYGFDSLSKKNHLKIGWLYFIFAWLSLFIINGIIDFMLTPGDWTQTRNFWDAFFNPTFWPAVFFRTAMALNFAGIFGYLTASLIKDPEFSHKMTRYCTNWLILPFIFMGLTLFWYLQALPAGPKSMILQRSPEIAKYIHIFSFIFPALLIPCLIAFLRLPKALRVGFAFILVATGLSYIGGFEWLRESARKPYIIYDEIYANAISPSMEKEINEKGMLQMARWTQHKTITPENIKAVGRRIFEIQCLSCHSIDGPLNDLRPLTKHHTLFSMNAKLTGLGKLSPYMPPFMGTQAEQNALSIFITEVIHGKTQQTATKLDLKEEKVSAPSFDPSKSAYVLLAWSQKGMHTMTDADRYFSFSPPGSTLSAQLIKRGELPVIEGTEVILSYEVDSTFKTPSDRSDFWKMSKHLTGKSIEKDKGISGNGLSGNMTFDEDSLTFSSTDIPVIPYTVKNTVMPYPMVTITARDKKSREVIAQTKTVLPVSTEWGCKNCHGGTFKVDGRSGISDITSENILIAHDRMSRTTLNKKRKKGAPNNCRACHSDNEKGKQLNLSASIHGFHTGYLRDKGSDACQTCHPSSEIGATRMLRGIHKSLDMDCSSCHGSLENLSMALLLNEKNTGKKSAGRLIKSIGLMKSIGLIPLISPKLTPSKDTLKPRKPHINMPDCLHCHIDFMPPDTDEIEAGQWVSDASERYSQRVDDAGIFCQACHGTTHAIYPTQNPYEITRENIQPLQYQSNVLPMGANKNCRLCHTIEMTDEMHHPNSLGLFRNSP